MTRQEPGSRATSDGNRLRCLATMWVLQRYLDGTLAEDRARHVADHLEECRRCGLEAEVYEGIKAALARQHLAVGLDQIERLRHFGEQLAQGDPTYGDRGD